MKLFFAPYLQFFYKFQQIDIDTQKLLFIISAHSVHFNPTQQFRVLLYNSQTLMVELLCFLPLLCSYLLFSTIISRCVEVGRLRQAKLSCPQSTDITQNHPEKTRRDGQFSLRCWGLDCLIFIPDAPHLFSKSMTLCLLCWRQQLDSPLSHLWGPLRALVSPAYLASDFLQLSQTLQSLLRSAFYDSHLVQSCEVLSETPQP